MKFKVGDIIVETVDPKHLWEIIVARNETYRVRLRKSDAGVDVSVSFIDEFFERKDVFDSPLYKALS